MHIWLKIADSNVPIEYMKYKNKNLEFLETKGNTAMVRSIQEQKNIPMQYLAPVAPDMECVSVRVCSVSIPRNENKNKNKFDGIQTIPMVHHKQSQ